jgi:hypothetical protein
MPCMVRRTVEDSACSINRSRGKPLTARTVFIGLAGLVLAISSLPLAEAQANDNLIVPRERIGVAALDKTPAELIAMLGKPTSILPGTVFTYNWSGLSATIVKDGLYATQICTTSPIYATTEGVRPGSTNVEVAALLGPPRYSRTFHAWWRLFYTDLYWPGLTVSIHVKGFETDNQVWRICVTHSAAIPE